MKPGDLQFYDPLGQDLGAGGNDTAPVGAMANATAGNGTAAANSGDEVSAVSSMSYRYQVENLSQESPNLTISPKILLLVQ